MKGECAQHSTEQKKPQEEIKMKGEEKSSEENEKKQTGKLIKTQECNVLTKYDISGFK